MANHSKGDGQSQEPLYIPGRVVAQSKESLVSGLQLELQKVSEATRRISTILKDLEERVTALEP